MIVEFELYIFQCLAMDLRNDILTGVVAILCAYLGDAYWKYSDALGAISVWWVEAKRPD